MCSIQVSDGSAYEQEESPALSYFEHNCSDCGERVQIAWSTTRVVAFRDTLPDNIICYNSGAPDVLFFSCSKCFGDQRVQSGRLIDKYRRWQSCAPSSAPAACKMTKGD